MGSPAGPPPKRRLRLPRPAQQEKSVSLWTLIKDMVGKDLTRVCLPVYFNEPLSALQVRFAPRTLIEFLRAACSAYAPLHLPLMCIGSLLGVGCSSVGIQRCLQQSACVGHWAVALLS
jgi:hypothetical protein